MLWSPPAPRELPALRESLADQMRSPFEHQALTQLLGMGRGTLSPQTGDYARDATILLEEERARLTAAELFYVTEDMTRLARTAAETLALDSFHPDDLPTQAGLMVFAEPIGVYDGDEVANTEPGADGAVQVVAVSWGPSGLVPTDKGMWVTLWSATDFAAEAEQIKQHLGGSRRDALRHVRQRKAELSWDNEVVISYNATEFGVFSTGNGLQPQSHEPITAATGWEQIRHTTIAWAQIVRAAWLLMTQDGVTDIADEPLPRTMRRRSQRAGYAPTPVRVVRIRHRANTPDHGAADSDGRTYHVRWTVRGHWRNQWYPSRSEHRPVWINSHIKGPDHAPLHTSETVHVLDQ